MDFFDVWFNFPIFFTTILVVFLILLIIAVTNWYGAVAKKLPPGSAGLPVVGYLPFIGRLVYLTLDKLAKEKFGNIFHLYLGNTLVVVLNDYATIKEALVKQADIFKGRPPDANFAEAKNENIGLIVSDGEHWRQHRRFITTNLKNSGVGNLSLEPLILNEIQYFLNEMKKRCGEATEVKELLNMSLGNNINILVTGQRMDYDHPTVKKMLQLFKDFNDLTQTIALQTFFPWIVYVPGIDLLLNRKRRRKMIQEFLDIVDGLIQRVKSKYVEGEKESYIQAYLTERNARLKQNKDEDIFSELGLLHNTRDLLAAGTDTSASTLLWALLYMTAYPEVQNKVQAEIDSVIGQQREPSFNDRVNTPYTEATIYEIHRIVSLAPLNPRRNLKETTLCGYHIPKDTMIISNLWAVHHDPKLWGDPECFRPERFIGPNGEAVKPEYLIPFCIGKRACVGEPLAKMEIYLYFTSLLQNFNFVAVNGEKPSLETKPGLFRLPKYPIVCAQQRTQPN